MTTPNEDNALQGRNLKLELMPKLSEANNSLLTRDFKLEIKADVDKGIIEGYASTFGNWDSYNDIIRPGAFSRTIAEKHAGREKSKIKFLWQHCRAQVLGLAVDLKEDSHGLHFGGKVSHPGELGKVALALAADGAIDAFSIGFDIYPDGARWLELDQLTESERNTLLANVSSVDDLYWMPPRELSAIDLWENSLVTWGANPLAIVEGVKAFQRTMVPGWRPNGKSKPDPTSEPKALMGKGEPEPVPEDVVKVVSLEGRALHVHFASVEEVRAFAEAIQPKASVELPPAPAPAPEAEPKASSPAPEPNAALHLTGLAEGIKALRESFAK